MSQEPIHIGIDVSKEQIDVAIRPAGRSWSVSYDGAGVDDLIAQLKSLKPAGVITESTGGLELPLVAALAAGLAGRPHTLEDIVEMSITGDALSCRPTNFKLRHYLA